MVSAAGQFVDHDPHTVPVSRTLTRLTPHLPLILPAVMSVAMAVVFRQPFFLLFGLMGPLVAIVQAVAAKQQRKRDADAARAKSEEAADKAEATRSIAVAAWCRGQFSSHPSVEQWLVNPLWRAEPASPSTQIRLGCGPGTTPQDVAGGVEVASIPMTVPISARAALVGHGSDARAVWRAIACQVLGVVSANDATGSQQVGALWARDQDPPVFIDVHGPNGQPLGRFEFIQAESDIPVDTEWVMTLSHRGSLDVYHRGVHQAQVHTPDRLSFAKSRWVRQRLVGSAGDDETTTRSAVDYRDRRFLVTDLGAQDTEVDMVSSGPHALVWGKTGSGKSVLIKRLIASLCSRYDTDRCGFVAIDFKGGATLGPLRSLPHARGLLTDLTPGETGRVAVSLRAEIRAREELFVREGVSSVEELTDAVWCPRTVIVVDEAGTLAQDAPEVMAVLADIATRGRSLGLHLLLSTQRPQHLPRDVVANCALRWCLGVTDSDEAAQYLPDAPTRLVKRLTGAPAGTTLHHSPHTGHRLVKPSPLMPEEMAALAASLGASQKHSPPPLWCPRLPDVLSDPTTDASWQEAPGKYLIGWGDFPGRQSQDWVWFTPSHDGPLIVVGESGSGHSSLTRFLATQATTQAVKVVRSGGRVDVLCHRLAEILRRRDTRPLMLVIDRLDRLLSGVPAETEAWVKDTLLAVSLDLTARGDGSAVILTVAPGSAVTSALSRWSATWCLLRHRNRDTWVAHGGDSHHVSEALPPGRGVIQGTPVQWVLPDQHSSGQNRDGPNDRSDDIARTRDDVLMITGAEHPSWSNLAMSVADAEKAWQEVKTAFTTTGIVFTGVASHHMRTLIGPGYDYPPVQAQEPYGWWVTTGGCALVRVVP